MALSLVAEEILTEHRVALLKAFKVASTVKGTDTSPANYERRLRDRMIEELRSHTDRAGTSHRHKWERMEQHANPDDLAALIEEARGHADKKEESDKAEALEEKHGVAAIQERLGAVEDHLVGNGDGRFGSSSDDVNTSVNTPDTGAGVARLLRHYRGRPLGIEARKAEEKAEGGRWKAENQNSDSALRLHPSAFSSEHAMTTPDPSTPGGARVVTWDENGPKTHSSHPDPHTALAHMVAAGYTEPAPGSYAEHAQSPDWDWLHQWAQTASSGDDTALDRFHNERPHPAARAARQNDTDRDTNHAQELTDAIQQQVGGDTDVDDPEAETVAAGGHTGLGEGRRESPLVAGPEHWHAVGPQPTGNVNR